MKPDSKVSIVVVTKNRHRQLMGCLYSISRQTYKHLEIIVVDSSDKSSRPLLSGAGVLGKFLKYIHNPLLSIPQARQTGIDASRSPYVMFLDDDCQAPPNWISSMVKLAKENPRTALISGVLIHKPRTNIYAQIISDIRKRRYELAGNTSWIYFNIENCLFRRSFLVKHKIRFDPTLLHEDFADIALQINKFCGNILLTNKTSVYHYERQNLGAFLRQRFKNSGNATRLRSKWNNQNFYFFSSHGISFLKTFMSRAMRLVGQGKLNDVVEYILIVLLSTTVYKLGNLYYGLLYSRRINGVYLKFKPLVDFVVAALVLTVSSPLMAAIAFIIKIDSKGPVLFSQIRLGRNRRKFTFYKFRTMFFDAKKKFPDLYKYKLSVDEVSDFRFKSINDPRLTRFGGYLRKTSLDELPNLVNILRGDMSLIGPRPEIPEMIQNYTKEEMVKFSVKPGVTGMAQVKGRGLLKFKETIRFDCDYARYPALLIDMEIVFRTIYVVIRGLGAF